MNTTSDSDQEFFGGPDNVRGFGYGIGVSVGIIFCIIAVALASYGLDEETIKSYPKLMYSEARRKKKECADACCSIWLAHYKGNDRLRLLPGRGHLFHLKCVDHWLRLHATCPVCRTSLLPTQLPPPLANDQVVPSPSRPDAGIEAFDEKVKKFIVDLR
ncbi:putative phosphatidylglycerol/phosphatidylinositol transfer protein [Hibiscus syriacus]|uniref:Phosphatidylglycerol/phosphatidylinositol transfer protein n=1 Tax=Hibiscus syriacus TaxID=106335 RepID=A0A6A2Y610_HIBSY|nr:putative phosphatidylglycerol/phosphatidylinositol transfer protein [Hibiscus syriacus]